MQTDRHGKNTRINVIANGGASIYKKREEYETDQFNIRERTTNNQQLYSQTHYVQRQKKVNKKSAFYTLKIKCPKNSFLSSIYSFCSVIAIDSWNIWKKMKEYLVYSSLVSDINTTYEILFFSLFFVLNVKFLNYFIQTATVHFA